MGAQPNAYGVRGMAADATIATYPEWTLEAGGGRRVDAIAHAIADSDPGDVVLLEMQVGYLAGNRLGPAELDPNVWNVVRAGGDAGVIVVAAAGNGNEDLDGPDYAFYRNRGDSKAIIVGAGTPNTAHDRILTYWGSTYGSRVNVQGWGESVVTLCCGGLAMPGNDQNQAYTATFNGTSSASPFVASAAAIIQQAARARTGQPLMPNQLRQLLIDTGIPQGQATPGHIGPFPNLRAALDGIQGGTPEVAWRTTVVVPIGESVPVLNSDVILRVPGGGQTADDVIVRYATQDGTAHGGDDYGSSSGYLTFPAGSSDGDARAVAIDILGDGLDEPDETFSIRLSDVQGGDLGTPDTLQVVIRDDDDPPTVSVGDCQVTEGDGVNVACTFTLSLSAASGRIVTVQYATLSGTAISGVDYVPVADQMNFPPGVTTRTVPVQVIGDLLDEAIESFSLKLSAPVHAEMGDDTGEGTIVDNDPPPALSVGNCSVTEANTNVPCSFTVSLSTASGQGVTVQYATLDGTAKSPKDYVPAAGTLTFPAGTTSRTVAVDVVGDLSDEPVETFSLKLSAPVNGTIADDTGVGTIIDDDPPPTMSIQDVKVSDRNFGTIAYLTVVLSAPSGYPVSVTYATADGTAKAGFDYIARNGLLSFPLDTAKRSVAIPIVSDVRDEGTESFRVTLSGAVNASILDGQADAFVVERSTPAPCAGRLDPVDDGTNLRVDLVISEIDPRHALELYNRTSAPVLLEKAPHWLVSPHRSASLAELGAGVVIPANGYARLPWPAGFIDGDSGGEILLYGGRDFDDSQLIVDFVCWGTNPHASRKDQAEEVGKWSGDCAPALSRGAIHRRAFTAGTSAADYDPASPPSPQSCAAAFKVTDKDDLGDGVCDGDCTLRDAVASANASPGHDTIFVPALEGGGPYVVGSSGGMVLAGDTDVVGEGARSTTVDGGGHGGRIFEIAGGAHVEIRGLTLRNGTSAGAGGAITSAGDLTLLDSTLAQNSAHDGGAIAITDGKALLQGVTLSDNGASGNGGALSANCAGCGVTLTNVTMSGNRANGDGGAVYHDGARVTLHNCTITANQANADGDAYGLGGGVSGTSTTTLGNTVLAGNTAVSSSAGLAMPNDCTDTCGCIVSEGYNLVGTDNACPFHQAIGDVVGSPGPIDPLFGPLANNRGPANTHELLTGSLAIDTARPSMTGPLACAPADERSFLRPKDGDGDQVSRCDKGAFELCPLPFTDVPAGSPIAPFVADLFCRGLASGCSASPPRFCTTDSVTRAQMAVLLIGALGEQPSGAVHNDYFSDVLDDGFAGYINRLYELGITAGCGSGIFCPDSVLSRKQMAVFLVVAMEERPSSEPYDRYFNDLDNDGFAPYVNRLYELGITGGCGNGAFCPNADTIRGDLAVFLGAAFFRY
jgi:hypothetical protein